MHRKEDLLRNFVLKIEKEVIATSQIPPCPETLATAVTYENVDWKQIKQFVTSQIETFETLQRRTDQSIADKELVNLFDISILLTLLAGYVRGSNPNVENVVGFLEVLFALCMTQNQVHEHFAYFLTHLSTSDDGAAYIMKSEVKIFLFKLPWSVKILPLRETLYKVHAIYNLSKISHLRRAVIDVQIVPLVKVLIEHLLKWTDIFSSTTDTSLLENELIGEFGHYLLKTLRNFTRTFSCSEKEHWFGVVYNEAPLFSKLRQLFSRDVVALKIRLTVLDLMSHAIYEMNQIEDLPNTIYSDRNLLLSRLKELVVEIQQLPEEQHIPFEKGLYHVLNSLQTLLSKLPPISGYELVRPFQDFFAQSTVQLDDPSFHPSPLECIQLELCFVCFQNILKIQVPQTFTLPLLKRIKNVGKSHLNGTLQSPLILYQAINTLCNLLTHDIAPGEETVHLISLLYRLLFTSNDPELNTLLLRCLSNLCFDGESAEIVFDMGYPRILDYCQEKTVFVDSIYLISLVMKYDKDFLRGAMKLGEISKLYASVFLYLESNQVYIPELLLNHVARKQTLFETLINMVHEAVLTLDGDILDILLKMGLSLLCHYKPDSTTDAGRQIIHINAVLKCYQVTKIMTLEKYAASQGVEMIVPGSKADKLRMAKRSDAPITTAKQ